MNSCFVLLGETYYEGDTLLGVYSTEDKAVMAENQYRSDKPGKSGYDEYKIVEVVVDDKAKAYWG